MAKLAKNVWAGGCWYGPDYPDAGDPPAGLITNPQCWDGAAPKASAAPAAAEIAPAAPEPVSGPVGKPPPRQGKGATDAAWTKYAADNGVSVTDAMSRGEVIAACEKAGVPTE